MRRNRRLRRIDIETESKKLIYIAIGCIGITILAFAITFVIYNSMIKKRDNLDGLTSKIAELPLETIDNEEDTESASSNIGKTINEIKEEGNITEEKNEIEKETNAINVSKTENINEQKTKEEITTNKEQNNQVGKKDEQENISNKENSKEKDPTFVKPIEGEIITQFANENLVYSNTLKEWTVHMGIDIKAEKASIVKATADGTVKSVKNDPRYGITVVVEHSNGYVSVYSNLLTAEFVKEDEKIKQGQTIGTVGNTSTFEIADESHLHFEILKDDVYVNPSEFIK